MSIITREWLQKKISAMEVTRDETPFGLDEDESNLGGSSAYRAGIAKGE